VPTIAKASIKNVRALEQIESIEAMGIEVIIKDFSLGGVMPCIGVCFIDASIPEGVQPRHVLKVGSHFDREAALTGCLTEYAQIAKLNQRGGEPEHDYEGLLNSDEADNFLPLFWFGYVPFASVDFLREGETVDFDPGTRFDDCLEDIEQALTICGHLGKDCVVVDLTDPDIGFPVVQVIVPGYSDILPYHPPDSSVLFTGWTREMPMGYYRDADGNRKPCTAKGFFPDW
ncbi:MAG: YcaO-like family protein, partial [Verrucomicrobiota bacterium]